MIDVRTPFGVIDVCTFFTLLCLRFQLVGETEPGKHRLSKNKFILGLCHRQSGYSRSTSECSIAALRFVRAIIICNNVRIIWLVAVEAPAARAAGLRVYIVGDHPVDYHQSISSQSHSRLGSQQQAAAEQHHFPLFHYETMIDMSCQTYLSIYGDVNG